MLASVWNESVVDNFAVIAKCIHSEEAMSLQYRSEDFIHKHANRGNFGSFSWILEMNFKLPQIDPFDNFWPSVQTKLIALVNSACTIFRQRREIKETGKLMCAAPISAPNLRKR